MLLQKKKKTRQLKYISQVTLCFDIKTLNYAGFNIHQI